MVSRAGGGEPSFSSQRVTRELVYQKKTPVEHVLLRPDSYVGSVDVSTLQRWVVGSEGRMGLRDVRYVPALYKIVDEVLVNATDNARRDPSQTYVHVKVDAKRGMVSVENDGATVPALRHPTEGVHLPELVFGHLLTGSNFDDASKTQAVGGRNGYGAKLANIFSSSFVVDIWDTERGVHYRQAWRDNMGTVEPPVLSLLKPSRTTSGTRITFTPDPKRFPPLGETDILSVIRTRCFDLAACNPGLAVTHNGERMPSSFEAYFALFDLHSLGSVFGQVSMGWELGVGVCDSSSLARHVSFVNSINTLRGGTHVDHVTDQIARGVAASMKKDPSLPAVTPAAVKNHLIVFLNCLVANPTFDSQTKETLTTKASLIAEVCQVPNAFVQRVSCSFLCVCVCARLCLDFFCSVLMMSI